MYYFAGHKDAYFIMANKKSSRLQDMEIQNNIKKKKKKNEGEQKQSKH
jgi:hypothetical protein